MIRITFAVLAALALACATEWKRPPPSLDPSNPEAPESPLPVPLTALAPEPDAPSGPPPKAAPAAHADHAHSHDGGHAHGEQPRPDAGAAAYTCPMHPEVVSREPTSCPKCGMRLLPAEPKHSHGGHP